MKNRYLPTTCIADAMGGHNTLDAAIKSMAKTAKLCGPAFTVKMTPGDNLALLRGIEAAKPGDVLVVDAGDYTKRTIAGDFVVGLMQVLGIAGLVTNGCVRDCEGIAATNFPVFCRAVTPAASTKNNLGEIQTLISCGGVAVAPSDTVVADCDGIVVVPQARTEMVFAKAAEKLSTDETRAKTYLATPETARQYLQQMLARCK